LSDALVPDAAHPVCIHSAGTRSALTAGDHPIDASEIEPSQMSKERFEGKEPDRCRGCAEMRNAGLRPRVLSNGCPANPRKRPEKRSA
jgi:hypothetical protein